ncbi:MAG: hypothetical protein A2X12_11620 [Bacteroidetes bacterium GWE2_29_8]|nr:MAG: hypothetical protein A2X12_11620 [Bacteroidetes bacterium GWE2_29_8]OFY24381.1 MAG: hypothetical protein A2X02_08295 [Bacteroidetes bacterium GWF2_29_10]
MNNKKLNVSLITAIFVMLLFNASIFAQKEKAPKNNALDGKIFTIELKIENTKKPKEPVPDELIFKSAKFTSKEFLKDMFKATVYDVEVDSSGVNKSYTFEVEQKNDKEEILKWEGTIEFADEETGYEIEGQCELTSKKGKLIERNSFTGTEKKKKKR